MPPPGSASAQSVLAADRSSTPAAAAAAVATSSSRHALQSQRIVRPRLRLSATSSQPSSVPAAGVLSSPPPPSPSPSPVPAPFLVRLRHYLAGALLSLTSVSSLSNFTSTSHSFSSGPAWLLGSRYRSLSSAAYHPVSHNMATAARPPGVTGDSSAGSSGSSSSTASSVGRSALLSDVASRFWFSYRSGFAPLSPDPALLALTSDAGWGCMIRSTQMLFAYALTLHYLGRHWRRQPNSTDATATGREQRSLPAPSSHTVADAMKHEQQQQQAYLSVLSWFLDSPSAPYSIHSLLTAPSSSPSPTASASASASSSPSTPRAGEWFGPTATCHMLLRCRAAQVYAAGGESHIDLPAILVSDDGTLYEDEIVKLCAAPPSPSSSSPNSSSPPSTASLEESGAPFRPIVILIPVRLGVDRINESYIQPMLACFQFTQSLGMMVTASQDTRHEQHANHAAPGTPPAVARLSLTVPAVLCPCCIGWCRAASLAPATGSSACRMIECCTSTPTLCSR